jgi:Spy/CpxP family protein refolding chaperone
MMKPRRKEVITMKKTIIGLSLALVLALVGAALAWGPGFGGPANGVPPIPNLTAEQSAQIQAMRAGFLKENESLQKELYAKGTELRNIWRSPNPDQAAIAAKRAELAGLQSQLADKAVNLSLEIGKVLTPEQLAQLPAFSQDKGFGPGAGFGPRGFGPHMGMRGPFGRW